MKRIYFRNSKGWSNVSAIVYNDDESVSEVIKPMKENFSDDFALDFDEENYDHILFFGENGEKTSKVYTGNLSMGVQYKKNTAMDRDMTYLFTLDGKNTGRVDNYIIKDPQNLRHRTDMSKKISVFVPESYDEKVPHDILYFFDAQNLFCGAGEYTDNGDPYGSWELDVVLSEIHRQYGKNIIVVGIDNADIYRDRELFMNPADFGELSPLATALPDEDYSIGYLDDLSNFIRDTLHPFIKEKYCISENNIGIGGSSMGGIASFYCGLREIGFYSYVISYSPAYGLYEMQAFENYFSTKQFRNSVKKLPKIHIYCGEGDMLEQMLISSSKQMKERLVKYGYDEQLIFETYDSSKPHNEESWRLILPQSFKYLF